MGGKKVREFIAGFVTVKVEVLNPEKFINMVSRYGMVMWDIERVNFTTLKLKMRYDQYRKIKTIARKTGAKIKIVNKHGAHFIFNKLRRRKFFIIGLIIFAAAIFYLSSIVWKIEITGNKNIETRRIYEALKKAGLSEGKFKHSIKLREVENAATKQINEISMMNIRFIGTYAKVEVVERTMPPSLIQRDKKSNIIASKDGKITRIIALQGQPKVKEGDIVKKGEILISGIVTDKNNVPLNITYAMGEIKAETWYDCTEEINLDYKYEIRTGQTKQKIYLIIGGKRVYLKNDRINFGKYDKIEEKSAVSLAGFDTPIEKVTEYYFEKVENSVKLSYEEAYQMAIEKAEEKLKKDMPQGIKIIDKKVEKSKEEGKVKVRVLYISEEDIGEEQEMK
ncbi:sporulation protein YqfD [Fonticella tunisiensis]|uniref:Stage IV sporulation protein n=1 Tax=Fonticella tunisiensis TaxID=1096341 RepID=A0A4R7KA22_9CLOT|nr:sporulation protein YqfD [Fonticella tunisiensis]TDT51098.1 hypothetical protein EDD71_12124 [Fonticella tunisiensis]